MIAPTIPNLAQLQHYRETGRFDPTLQAGKLDVMKSAESPPIVGLKINGKLVGFGKLEIPTPDELSRVLKQPVSKSAKQPDTDANAVFDDSPLIPVFGAEVLPLVQSIGQMEVSKSAELPSEPDVLEGIFPQWLRTN